MKHDRFLLQSLLCVLFLSFSSFSYANEINLYAEPKADAKVTSTLDLAAGVIPIFTPKTGDWIKVADPRNGNVGWIKSNELNKASSKTTITYTERIINQGRQGSNSYQIIEWGTPHRSLSSPNAHVLAKKMEAEHRELIAASQKWMNEMVNEMNAFYQHHHYVMGHFFPLIMPIVVMTPQKDSTKLKVPANPTTEPPAVTPKKA